MGFLDDVVDSTDLAASTASKFLSHLKMETIKIPQVHLMMKQFKRLDNYFWYCRLLARYSNNPFFLDGMTAPCYVAKMIATQQSSDPLLGISEVRDFLKPIINLAYVLNVQTPRDAQFGRDGFKTEDVHTFYGKTVQDLNYAYAVLNEKLSDHKKLISDIRYAHQSNFEWRRQMTHRTSKIVTFLKERGAGDASCLLPKHKQKYEMLKTKQINSRDRLVCESEWLRHLMDQEKVLRETITEITNYIKDTMLEKMKSSLEKSYSDLVEAANGIADEDGFKIMMNELWDFKFETVANRLIEVFSLKYVTPVPEDFLSETGFQEKLPKSKYQIPEFVNQSTARNNLYYDSINLTCDRETVIEDDCFFVGSRGVRTVLDKNLKSDSSHGVIHIKQGYQVKIKLTLWNNQIGFGWTKKKSLFSSKSWGFFALPNPDVLDPLDDMDSLE